MTMTSQSAVKAAAVQDLQMSKSRELASKAQMKRTAAAPVTQETTKSVVLQFKHQAQQQQQLSMESLKR